MNLLSGLIADIEAGLHAPSLSSVFGSLATILELFEQNYVADKNAKNAAIDTVVAMLQKMKS